MLLRADDAQKNMYQVNYVNGGVTRSRKCSTKKWADKFAASYKKAGFQNVSVTVGPNDETKS